jgi:transposase, IS30 family
MESEPRSRAEGCLTLRTDRPLTHSPWQRGSIENANGRLRRDPRKTSLGDYSDVDIDDVIWNLNTTPRKCLGYRTPIEAFAANLGVALEK